MTRFREIYFCNFTELAAGESMDSPGRPAIAAPC